MLRTVLNVCRPLTANWFADYGITSDRNRTLLAPFPERNSFEHPGSETALTLFMLGNLDRWKQVGQFQNGAPRNEQGSWSNSFFSTVCGPTRTSGHQECGMWSGLGHGIFADTGLNWSGSTLVFEFEVMNSQFHSINGEPFKSLSFLDIQVNRKWGAFDAFMVAPSTQPTDQYRGTLIGFEAKLESDISRRTTGFQYVNQVMRNLEAGYWLTHHPDSLYRTWQFHYVFICPRDDFEMKAALYAWMLADKESRREAAHRYRAVLECHGAAVDQEHFDSFCRMVADRVTVLHWDQLADVLRRGQANFFPNYFQALAGYQELAVVAANTRRRFERAGIDIT
jgi:hypothetical protein